MGENETAIDGAQVGVLIQCACGLQGGLSLLAHKEEVGETRQRWPNQVGPRCKGLSSCGWRPGNTQDETLLTGVAHSFF